MLGCELRKSPSLGAGSEEVLSNLRADHRLEFVLRGDCLAGNSLVGSGEAQNGVVDELQEQTWKQMIVFGIMRRRTGEKREQQPKSFSATQKGTRGKKNGRHSRQSHWTGRAGTRPKGPRVELDGSSMNISQGPDTYFKRKQLRNK